MKIASFQIAGRRTFGMVEGDRIFDIGGVWNRSQAELRAALALGKLGELASRKAEAASYALREIEWLPVVPNPDKILCVGVNYETHRQETGRKQATYPTIFLRLANSQTGHGASILRPKVSRDLDFEGELAVIIGHPGRYISEREALAHVAGYSCYNDATLRDWQSHTHQFTPGKNFPRTGAFGPWLTTADEIGDIGSLHLTTRLNGTVMQEAQLDQLIFSIPQLIAYCSSFTRLEPGDVISTGTPGGVGFKRTPPVFLKPGDRIEVEIPCVGTLTNGVEDDVP
ncbi:MAG TPA: fumarylacetoacetate hydrolase family protein [Bryobacteraceae bacterium]|nr:fumarylacetoacetate hydrolase family protein [Bryobacteraceae bacterium]